MNQTTSFTISTSEDWEKLAKFLGQFNTKSVRRSHEPQYYEWKIKNNPFKKGIFYMATIDGEVVGTASLTPKKINFNGLQIQGAEIGDTFTDERYQRKGIFSRLVNTIIQWGSQNCIEFIYGTPNQNSLPGYVGKLSFIQLPNIKVRYLVFPLNIDSVLSAIFPKLKFAFKTIGMLVSFIYGLYYNKQFKNCNNVKKLDAFPEDIEEFLDKALLDYNCCLIRDAKYLEWRFINSPDKYDIWVARDLNKTKGYLVAKVGMWNDLKVAYVADFLTANRDEFTFLDLMKCAITFYKEYNIDMIATWSVKDSHYYKKLRQLGFKNYKDVPIICYKNKFGKRITEMKIKCHFTMSDSDNI